MSLERLTFAKFEFCLLTQEQLILPTYKGAAFRGAFGHTFKRVVCISRHKDCPSCLVRDRCVYSYVFETPPPSDTHLMRKYPYAPHPFIILPPLEHSSHYPPHETLTFTLTLVGKAIDFLPYFIYTISEMGEQGLGRGRGKACLNHVYAIRADSSKNLIYQNQDKLLHSCYNSITLRDIIETIPENYPDSILSLNFITPTRIRYQEKLVLELTFPILLRNLLRRLSLLAYFHCQLELKEVDFKGLIEESHRVVVKENRLTWYDWERYSQRQSRRMKLGGFVGQISFAGPWQKFFPYIALGQWLHVGKGTSFGLGYYQIS